MIRYEEKKPMKDVKRSAEPLRAHACEEMAA